MNADDGHITKEGYEANCSSSSNPVADVLVQAADKYIKCISYQKCKT